MSSNVVGIFNDVNQVESTVEQLRGNGVDEDRISMVATTISGNQKVHGIAHEGRQTGRGAGRGAGWGAASGGLFGLLVGSALIWIPGVGPILAMGPIAAGLSGAVTGAGGGAIVGALVGHGIPKEVATSYEAEINQGKYLLVVAGDDGNSAAVSQVLRDGGATQVAEH